MRHTAHGKRLPSNHRHSVARAATDAKSYREGIASKQTRMLGFANALMRLL
jgi:hypothetical protein